MSDNDLQITKLEPIDIGEKAKEKEVYSEGQLEHIDRQHGINFRWLKERVILILSCSVIAVVTFFCIAVIGLADNPESLDWARQTITAIFGFAAGAIWTSTVSKNESGS